MASLGRVARVFTVDGDEEGFAVAAAKPNTPEKPQPRREEERTPPPPPPGSYVPPKSPEGLVVTFRKGEPVREDAPFAK